MTKSSKKAAKKTSGKKATKKQAIVAVPTKPAEAAETKPVETPVQEAASEAKTTKKAKAAKATRPPKPPRETKAGLIRQMIQREGGASVEELVKAADWQSHSVRGFISNLGRKQGLKVETIKREDGTRAYFLAPAK